MSGLRPAAVRAVRGTARVATRTVAAALKPAAAVVDRLSPPGPGAVVLAYHQVGGPRPSGVNLSTGAFAEQMAWLAAERGGRRVVSLDEVVTATAAAEQPSRDLVCVTFDDGTADFVDHAVPVLVEHGIPVTLYLATAAVEEGRSFWDDGTVLSWGALADVLGTGLVTIGCHTHHHLLLDRTPAAVAAADLDRSLGLIGDRLGVEARHLAFPKALAPSAAVDIEVRARFASAAVAGGRPNRYGGTDPWRLGRTPVVVGDGFGWFTRKAAGGLRLEGVVREHLDRRRYAGAER